MSADLTRWNRAGLRRLRYVDGNAASYYEQLRAALRAKFAGWPAGAAPGAQEDDERRNKRLEDQYTGARGDWGEELARTLARGCHILTEYLDAYANESALRTATQWDSVRRLVEILGYHPAPPASAATPLVVMAKAGKRGRLARGFAVKHSPPEGGPAVVFETLADLELDGKLNELRLEGHGRSPRPVTGGSLLLERKIAGLKLGDPLVLEREGTGFTLARLISGIADENGRTRVSFDAPISQSAGLHHGRTLVHLKPADRLAPLGPAQAGSNGLDSLLLADEPRTLAADDVVYISDGASHYFRQARAVEAGRVTLDAPLGALRLDRAWMSHARRVSVSDIASRPTDAGSGLYKFRAAGDLSAAATPPIVADFIVVDGAPRLAQFDVVSAKYVPPNPTDPESGYTTFTVGVTASKKLDNPQAVYLPAAAREWRVDSYLEDGSGDLLPATLRASLPKAASAGDLAVVVSGQRLGWARLQNVAADSAAGRAELTVERWHTRGSGRFYLSRTRIYGGFAEQARLEGWSENDEPASGAKLTLNAAPPDLLVVGRRLWIEQQRADGFTLGREAAVTDVDGSTVHIDRPLGADEGFTLGNTVLRGNVVTAGHGETQPERILGSGDAAALHQSFVLGVAGVSFVADPSLPAGVRADIDVKVGDRIWEQRGTLDDSREGDTHYTVRMTEDGFLRIAFGDGRRGRRLPTGANNVRVRYRLGAGLAGNLGPGRLEKPARPHTLVDKLRQPAPASGGADMESAAALKRSAPASVLTLERAVSAVDYAHLAAAHAAVWRARAFAQPSALRSPRIEVVVVPAGGAPLDERLAQALRQYLVAHSLPGVAVTVTEFTRVWLHLDVRLRVVSAEHDPQAVKAQAAARLAQAFSLEQRDIGAPLYLSDVYAAVEAIPGVRNSSCALAFDRGGEPQPAGQRVDAGAREVVFLDRAARPGALRLEIEEFEL